MPHDLSTAADLINAPLRAFPPPSTDSLTVPEAHASVTTQKWASKMLASVVLGQEWDWKSTVDFLDFNTKLSATGKVSACVPDPLFRYPRSEADVVTRVNDELINPVYRVGKGWLSPPPVGQSWFMEVLSEAYARKGQDTQYPIGGVRVDGIIAVSTEIRQGLRMRTTPVAGKTDDVRSTHSYLPRDKLWEYKNDLVDITPLKGLVAVEIKNYGVLDKAGAIMQKIANKKEPLGISQSKVPDVKGIRAVLQQALRYTHHYGTNYAYVTDFKTGILVQVPPLVEKPKALLVVRWAVVHKEDARKALAFLLHCACANMSKAMNPKS